MPGKRRGRGEGGIEELPSGKFRAVINCGRDPVTKKRLRATFTHDTKRVVLTWLRGKLDEKARGPVADPGRTTLGEWMTEWLASKKAKIEPQTYRRYSTHSRLYITPYLGAVKLRDLTRRRIEAWYVAMAEAGVTAKMQRAATPVLRSALREAVVAGLLNSADHLRVKPPKDDGTRKMRALDPDQVVAVVAAAKALHNGEAYYRLAFDSGMRPGEMLALHWSEVDLAARTVTVSRSLENLGKQSSRMKAPKSAAGRRTIIVSEVTAATLRSHREAMRAEKHNVTTGVVFRSERGRDSPKPPSHAACTRRSSRRRTSRFGLTTPATRRQSAARARHLAPGRRGSTRPRRPGHGAADLRPRHAVGAKTCGVRVGRDFRHWPQSCPTGRQGKVT